MTNYSDQAPKPTSRKKKLLNLLQYAIFFLGGIGIFIWVYRGQSPDQIWKGLARFDYFWIIISFLLALMSHFFRALRWRMMIKTMGYNPKVSNTFLAILIMYLANFALPRLGEVTRCGVLKRYEKVPFTPQLGTVVAERAVDFIVLVVLVVWVFIAEWTRISGFMMSQQLDQESFVIKVFTSGLIFWIIGGGLLVVLLIVLFRKPLSKLNIAKKLVDLFKQFVTGLKSVLKVRSPLLFILLTILIYASYFGMTFVVFVGFEPTSSLGWLPALTVLTLGSVGMVLPVQGGIGTYHFFAVETLLLYGVLRDDGQLFALVLHGSMSLFLILIGAIALILLPILNRNRT